MAKEKVNKTLELVKDMAKQLGYELVKKETEKELGKIYQINPYKGYSSSKLLEVLADVNLREEKYSIRNRRIREKVVKFMTESSSNELTKPLYDGKNFLGNKLIIRDKTLSKISQIREYTKKMLCKALSKEFKDKFINLNREYEFIVDSLSVEDGPVGALLYVNLDDDEDKI